MSVSTNPEKIDGIMKEMQNLIERAKASDNPLTVDIEKIVTHHIKLLRRFEKIVSLSDSYQSQLRNFNIQLEIMAHTDPLTHINNRGYFMELLQIELDRAQRYGRIFSVMMLDLDHFKSVNDLRGHAAGDEALQTLCKVLKLSELRTCDFIGRLGGEEFAVALPETNIIGVTEVAERIRRNIEKAVILHNGNEFFITASIGVSEYRAGDTQETILGRADQAMYQSKKTGRNKVSRA